MFCKIELSFQSKKSQREVKQAIDKILELSDYTVNYNIKFSEQEVSK